MLIVKCVSPAIGAALEWEHVGVLHSIMIWKPRLARLRAGGNGGAEEGVVSD